MARSYTVTKYKITVIDNRDGSKRIWDDDELRKFLSGNSDIRQNSFWRLLYHKYLSFEDEEDYKILGLPSPNDDWSILYNIK